MSFLDLARRRRSVRRYRSDPVPPELLDQVLEAGLWAPSAVNTQPWEFIVVTDPAVKQALYDLSGVAGLKWKHLLSAPVVIVLAARKLTAWSRDDCLLAAQNLMLCAADLGLGTCWIGGLSEEGIRQALSLPAGFLVPGMMTLGYPEGELPHPPGRRALSAVVHHNTFQGRGLDLSHVGRFARLVRKLFGAQFKRRGDT
jgi:nitroreductase